MQLFKKGDLSSCVFSIKGDKNYTISVDIKSGIVSSNSGGIIFNTGDINTAKLTVMLMDGYNRYDINNKKILCNIIRPDGTDVVIEGNVTSNGYVEFNLGYSGICQEGIYTANIGCIWKESQLNTPTFTYKSTRTIVPNDIVQEDDRFPILTELVGEISDKLTQLELDMESVGLYIQELTQQITQHLEGKELELTQKIEEFKGQVKGEIDDYKEEKNLEIDSYISNKDKAINAKLGEVDEKLLTVDPKLSEVDVKLGEVEEVVQEVNSSVSSKLGQVDTKLGELSGKLSQVDTKLSTMDSKIGEVNNKVGEVNNLIESIPATVEEKLSIVDTKVGEVDTKISQVDTKISQVDTKLGEVDTKLLEVDTTLNAKLEEVDLAIEGLGVYGEQISHLEEVNTQQDTRMANIEDKNKVQDIYINSLYNENKDKRISTTGEGNSVELTGSAEGLVEVTKIVGNTYTNLWTGKNLNLYGGAQVVNGYLDFTTQGNGFINFFFTNKSKFKPSTNYTLIANVITNELGSNANVVFTSNSGGNASQQDIFTASQSRISGGSTGKFVYKLTTKDNFDNIDNAVRGFIHNIDSGSGRRVKIGIVIVEGHLEEPMTPNTHFIGMQSTFEDVKVTEEMISEGGENEENLNKYKCEITVSDSSDFISKKAIYLTTPLLELDEIVVQEDGIYHKHNCEYFDIQSLNTGNIVQDNYTVGGTRYTIFKISVNKHTSTFSECTKLKFVGNSPNQITGTHQYYITGSNDFWVFMPLDTTKEAFLEYIRDAKLVVSLKNPTMEKVAEHNITLNSNEGVTLSTVSNVPCANIDVTYTGNLPSIYKVEEDGFINSQNIEVTQTALDYVLMSVVGLSAKNKSGGNNMGAYFASRILKGALDYREVVAKYPEFKEDIDFILKSEGREDLIK